jgi:hypothetical protein
VEATNSYLHERADCASQQAQGFMQVSSHNSQFITSSADVRHVMDDSSLASSSSSDNDVHNKRRRNSKKRRHRSKHHKDDIMKKLPPAKSDWEALRSHFQFVLPDEEGQSSSLTGARWQDRMVKHYHSHLYKEYVLADLSRVLEIGKVGLRWRTEDEVKSGRGFRSCGNLKCQSTCHNNLSTLSTEKKEAYDAAVRRSEVLVLLFLKTGGKNHLE